jgi:threonine/homoserine/homoserine lactone efflux protein
LPHLTLPLSLPALVASAYFVSLATVVVPGPITLVATRLALSRSIYAAISFLVGTTVLDVALFSALAAGAAPSLHRIGALPIVEIVGGLALIWGGLASFRSPSTRHEPGRIYQRTDSDGLTRSFLLGLLVSAGNPHYWIWWATAGLAFVEAARAHGAPGMAWMLGALIAGVVSWYIPLLWALRRGRALLSARAERFVTRGMAVALVVLGAGLITLGAMRL